MKWTNSKTPAAPGGTEADHLAGILIKSAAALRALTLELTDSGLWVIAEGAAEDLDRAFAALREGYRLGDDGGDPL